MKNVRAELALKLEDVIRAKAKENLSASGGDRKSSNAKSGFLNSRKAVQTDKELGKIAGVSKDTIWKTTY